MSRLVAWTCGLALFCGNVVPAFAEPIRVALLLQADSVTVASPQGLLLRSSLDGELEWLNGRPVTVSAGPGGLLVNGKRWRADSLEIKARAGDTMVNDLRVGGKVVLKRQNNRVLVVNELDLEEYLLGVVPAEMSSAWHPEALKTQAVAARTYALHQRMTSSGRDYDLVAGTQDQVYRGRHGVDQRIRDAVEDTRDIVLTHHNAPIFAAFSSTAAGPTEDAVNVWSKDLPYLKGVDCPFDASSPYYKWRNSFKVDALEANLRQQGYAVGTVASLTPFWYSRAGRVTRVRILHSDGELILRGEDLRRIVGYGVIPSTHFQVESFGRDVVLTGRGNGHAVGLCQWGAKELAELGYPYAAILHYYFPGTELKPASSLSISALSP